MQKKILFFITFLLIFSHGLFSNLKILVGSPIYQKPEILNEFLLSLKELNDEGIIFDYYFVDDNEDLISKNLLTEFSSLCKTKCIIEESNNNNHYFIDDYTHHWNDSIIDKVSKFKNRMISYAKENDYDYLFLIDSDIVLHPETIKQLLKANKDIISNIFWTKFYSDKEELPQVWISGVYSFATPEELKTLSTKKLAEKRETLFNKWKIPGIYEVGGLGACTLISKKALNKGISFDKIYNISIWGEDRHFCIRAIALGFSLFVDTHYPALHLYRDSDLDRVEEFKKNNKKSEETKPKITLGMIVKNEANRHLRKMLEDAKTYISSAVIIDDGSSDNTVEICKEVLEGIPLKLIENKVSLFSYEYVLRKKLWDEVINTNPEWILILDADEIFEEKFKYEIHDILKNTDKDAIYFRLYDLWDDENLYRDDKFWVAHKHFIPFLIRNKKEIKYEWKKTPVHCGRFPLNIYKYMYELSPLRIKHYGWLKKEDRECKYKRYMTTDGNGKYGWKEQYETILDENPNLIPWEE